MKLWIASLLLLNCLVSGIQAADASKTVMSGLKNPASVCFGPRGLLYVTEPGERGKDGDGRIIVLQQNEQRTFASGLDDPCGLSYYHDALWIVDKTRIVKVDDQGRISQFAGPEAFPSKIKSLRDITIDGPSGIALISDQGDSSTSGAVFRLDIRLMEIKTVADESSIPLLKSPHGVVFDGGQYALVADRGRGKVHRVNLADRSFETVASGVDGVEGVIWDPFGRLFLSSGTTGLVVAIPRPGMKPIKLESAMSSAIDGCIEGDGQQLLIVDSRKGTLNRISAKIPDWTIDESPVPATPVPAFTRLKWTGWDDGSESGKENQLRPVFLTHPPDGSNRIFVLLQQGQIHAFENNDEATQTRLFLDLSKQVRYTDRDNEEGLLGLAFHPNYQKNGLFYVYYTDSRVENANVLSRFKVQPGNRDAADASSEEELLRIEKPHRNHNGGTIFFGKDGYLYVTHGDGGGGGDPRENGQNLTTLLGKILRIDVDKKSPGKKYGIPADNPFAKQQGVAPEIWAYGFRNVWRMSQDRETGQIWAADVGDGLYEEINLVTSGGNYGWNFREGLHPFSRRKPPEGTKFIDPIWEYHHDVGRSITGGVVYRGRNIPELQGLYLYADHISNRAGALRYDPGQRRVVSNHLLERPPVGVMSFGEDQSGEVYATGAGNPARCIYRYEKTPRK